MAPKRKASEPTVNTPPLTQKNHIFYGLQLDEQQEKLRDSIWDPEKLIVFCDAKAGTGKAQPIDTLIPTPLGMKKMGDLRVGDYVFGGNGKKTMVTGIYPQGELSAYKVMLKDGRYTICSNNHLWSHYVTSSNKLKTLTLQQMMDKGIRVGKKQGARYRIPSSPFIETEKKSLSIDPYVIGAFLGDGCCKERQLTLSSKDEELVSEVCRLLGAKEYARNSESNFSWRFLLTDTQRGENTTQRSDVKYFCTDEYFLEYPELKNASYDKKIPNDYLFSSYEDKMAQLQGLFDTDGSIVFAEGRYNVRYTSTSKELANGVAWVLRSCGYGASITEDIREGKYFSGVCYNVFVSSCNKDKKALFRLRRKYDIAEKASFVEDRKKYDRTPLTGVVDLGYKTEMVCISVANEDGLYLTNDFIVTHNTTIAVATANMLARYNMFDSIVYIVAPCNEDRLGMLPGGIDNKLAPYSTPLYQALVECGEQPEAIISQDENGYSKNGAYIYFTSHTYLRGTNYKDKIVIIDEAQNYSFFDLKKTLTRCLDSSKVIVIGHAGQRDTCRNGVSAFERYIEHFKGDPRTAVCPLTKNYRGWIASHADELV